MRLLATSLTKSRHFQNFHSLCNLRRGVSTAVLPLYGPHFVTGSGELHGADLADGIAGSVLRTLRLNVAHHS